MISDAKIKNSRKGNISFAQHKINLKSKFKMILKKYPVQIGLQDKVRDRIEELISKKIILEKQKFN